MCEPRSQGGREGKSRETRMSRNARARISSFLLFAFEKKRKCEEVSSKRSLLCAPPVVQTIDPSPPDEMGNFCVLIGRFGQGTVQYGT